MKTSEKEHLSSRFMLTSLTCEKTGVSIQKYKCGTGVEYYIKECDGITIPISEGVFEIVKRILV